MSAITSQDQLNTMLRTRLRAFDQSKGRDYIAEALLIIKDETMLIAEKEHLIALWEEVCRLKGKVEGLIERLAVREAEKEEV